MSGSIFGKHFSVSTFGESHGLAIGVIIDGCPSNIPLTKEDIMKNMVRRKPGNAKVATARKESDAIDILSGVFEGKTTGTPICLMIRNEDQRSHNYDNLKDVYRPSHADYPYQLKYENRDYRGGGRSSARETAARVAAGSVAMCVLSELGIHIQAYTKALGPITINDDELDYNEITNNLLSMPHATKALEALDYIGQMKAEKDSIGGVVECQVIGMPVGVGEPVFDRLDAVLGQAIMSINAVKAFEVGEGVKASTMKGSAYNDSFYTSNNLGHYGEPTYRGHGYCGHPKRQHVSVHKYTNHSGGILGGLSDGSPILLRAHFKPTPSIALPQQTINHDLENVELTIEGRHDPTVVTRAVVVVEAMTALALCDLLLCGATSRIDQLKAAYRR
ncbi:MAG: chorismate synthase [Niameybacter sp.]